MSLAGGLEESIICLAVKSKDVLSSLEKLQGTELSVEMKKTRKKRSMAANRYAWELINEMANVLRKNKDDLYVELLKQYGQREVISVASEVSLAGFVKYFEPFGKGEVNGKQFTHYYVFKGSSEYDSREMAIFIDGIVDEAKDLGIETLPPDEIAAMNARWAV